VVTPWAAVVCGVVAAPVLVYGEVAMEMLKIDDPVRACVRLWCVYTQAGRIRLGADSAAFSAPYCVHMLVWVGVGVVVVGGRCDGLQSGNHMLHHKVSRK